MGVQIPHARWSANPTGEAGGAREDTLHAVVQGSVQGVGFRFFVLGVARRLGLTGSVRNRSDGRVEVFARGTRPDLEQLLGELRQGPRMARVEHVEVEWHAEVPRSAEFTIGF